MSTLVAVRQEWADGNRRLESEREDPRRYRLLRVQTAAIAEELRRRIGSVFTLADLADEYGRAERWSREVLAELPPEAQWAPGRTVAVDAAFHQFSRGARDYEP
jgi:hypothetical protein